MHTRTPKREHIFGIEIDACAPSARTRNVALASARARNKNKNYLTTQVFRFQIECVREWAVTHTMMACANGGRICCVYVLCSEHHVRVSVAAGMWSRIPQHICIWSIYALSLYDDFPFPRQARRTHRCIVLTFFPPAAPINQTTSIARATATGKQERTHATRVQFQFQVSGQKLWCGAEHLARCAGVARGK